MVESGLTSTNPKELKGARAVIKGKITSAITGISSLEKNSDGSYDHSRISRTNVLSNRDKLVTNVDLMKKVHDRLCTFMDRGNTDAEEESILEKEEEYISSIEKKAHTALDMFDEYEILYKAFITAKNAKDDAQSKLEAEEMAKKKIEADIMGKEVAYLSAVEDYKSAKEAINEVLEPIKSLSAVEMKDSGDVMLCPAENLIDDVTSTFNKYKELYVEFSALLGSRGDAKEAIDARVNAKALKNLKNWSFRSSLVN